MNAVQNSQQEPLKSSHVTIIGAGLAGCEAAMQLADRGIRVRLHEMKPGKRTPAQTSDSLAELVCSNSLRGAAISNAVGLLKEELRRAGSLIIQCALANRLPAGGALAVDRERFAAMVTSLIHAHPLIELVAGEASALPSTTPTIIATGPLTSDALAADLARHLGAQQLAYYDAIAPIIDAESINWDVVWKQSRYDKGTADYVNCPFTEEQYDAFVKALRESETVIPQAFEDVRYFEGCLPCEVMAERGRDTLAYGPMKPKGLTDPRTGRRPFAVVQLRAEDAARSAYNLVGFQSRMKRPDQKRVFRMVPGLENAEFMRFGAVHRNTFINAPERLDDTMQLTTNPGVYAAGQITGVEGYVESAAAGLLCALFVEQKLRGREPLPPPNTTAFGGLLTQLGRVHPKLGYQPSNITWAHFPALEDCPRKLRKRDRYERMAARAVGDLDAWLQRVGGLRPAAPKPMPPPAAPEKAAPADAAPTDAAPENTTAAAAAAAAPSAPTTEN